MKKIGMLLMAAAFAFGTLTVNAQEPEHKNKATHNKVTQNKATKETAKGAEKVGKGAKHGAYDVSHNKATKKTDINKGNKRYKYQNDM